MVPRGFIVIKDSIIWLPVITLCHCLKRSAAFCCEAGHQLGGSSGAGWWPSCGICGQVFPVFWEREECSHPGSARLSWAYWRRLGAVGKSCDVRNSALLVVTSPSSETEMRPGSCEEEGGGFTICVTWF